MASAIHPIFSNPHGSSRQGMDNINKNKTPTGVKIAPPENRQEKEGSGFGDSRRSGLGSTVKRKRKPGALPVQDLANSVPKQTKRAKKNGVVDHESGEQAGGRSKEVGEITSRRRTRNSGSSRAGDTVNRAKKSNQGVQDTASSPELNVGEVSDEPVEAVDVESVDVESVEDESVEEESVGSVEPENSNQSSNANGPQLDAPGLPSGEYAEADEKDLSLEPNANGMFECTYCLKEWDNESKLKIHFQTHVGKRLYDCIYCPFRDTYLASLNRHTGIHGGFQCTFCPKKIQTKQKYDDHLNTHTGAKPYECLICQDRFATKNTLFTHFRLHDESNLIPCTLCDRKVKTKASLESHMASHLGDKMFQCPICFKGLSSKSYWKDHMNIHNGEKPHKCKLCDYSSALRSHVIRHMQTHTDERPFACDQCEKSYKTKPELTEHMYVHTGERPYACNLCPATFRSRLLLSGHMRTHQENQFECEICGLKLCAKNVLKDHMRTHTGETPYVCTVCSLKVSSSSALGRHMELHGEKNHKCEYCERKFYRKATLTQHRRTHTDESPFECLICETKFTTNQGLQIHKEAKHAGSTLRVGSLLFES